MNALKKTCFNTPKTAQLLKKCLARYRKEYPVNTPLNREKTIDMSLYSIFYFYYPSSNWKKICIKIYNQILTPIITNLIISFFYEKYNKNEEEIVELFKQQIEKTCKLPARYQVFICNKINLMKYNTLYDIIYNALNHKTTNLCDYTSIITQLLYWEEATTNTSREIWNELDTYMKQEINTVINKPLNCETN